MRRDLSGKSSSSALVYCSHGTPPLPPSTSLSLFVLSLPSCFLYSAFLSVHKSNLLHKILLFYPLLLRCSCFHSLACLLLSQITETPAPDSSVVWQSVLLTPPSIPPSFFSYSSSDLSAFASEEPVDIAVCRTRLSVSIKIKYSCARFLPRRLAMQQQMKSAGERLSFHGNPHHPFPSLLSRLCWAAQGGATDTSLETSREQTRDLGITESRSPGDDGTACLLVVVFFLPPLRRLFVSPLHCLPPVSPTQHV